MHLMRKLVWSKLKSTLKNQRKNGKDGSGSLVNKSNVNEEYVEALRTKSYVEMYNIVQGQIEGGKLDHDSKLSSSSSLQLDTNLCQEALSEIPESCQLHPLIINYFNITLEACRICEFLLQNVRKTRANYRKIRRAIRLMNMESVSSVYRELATFASIKNPFSVVNQEQILEKREGHDLLLQKLSSQFRRVNRRMKFLKYCKRVFGISITIGYTGVMIALLVLALHSMVCIAAAPGLIACSYKVFKKRWKVGNKKAMSSSSLQILIAQLDVAAKGVFILINDFGTMSRLVRRLYDEIEHKRSVADMCARKRNTDMLKEAIRDYSIHEDCFMEQLKELEEHICLCFLNINRSRRMALQEMVSR